MPDDKQPPKIIQVDDDWKAQARAEKDRLAEKTAAPSSAAPSAARKATAGAPGGSGYAARPESSPKADLPTLVSTLAAQALLAMGVIPDPRTGQRMQSLDIARYHIDTLALIETKTKGNLTADEESTLASTLYELRTRYIQACQAARAK